MILPNHCFLLISILYLPESNVISLIIIHLAAKDSLSLTKRPTLLCNLMLTFLDVSNILSSIYV